MMNEGSSWPVWAYTGDRGELLRRGRAALHLAQMDVLRGGRRRDRGRVRVHPGACGRRRLRGLRCPGAGVPRLGGRAARQPGGDPAGLGGRPVASEAHRRADRRSRSCSSGLPGASDFDLAWIRSTRGRSCPRDCRSRSSSVWRRSRSRSSSRCSARSRACRRNPVAYGIAGFYTSFFRGTPLIVQLFLIYFGLARSGRGCAGTPLQAFGGSCSP